MNDCNVNDIGRLTILPSTYVGSPRQDAMSYVRKFGLPDLFITFTCNPQWAVIKNNLFNGQNQTDRHDIAARVFRLKVKALMDLINKIVNFWGGALLDVFHCMAKERAATRAHLDMAGS